MSNIMLKLGVYSFSLSTAAYDNLRRIADYRWAVHEPIGNHPVMQYVGPGGTMIELSGSIFPRFKGGLDQIDRMRDEAGRGEPLALVNGLGHHLGRWCIERVEETQMVPQRNGAPRRIDFNLKLRHYDLGRSHAWDLTT